LAWDVAVMSLHRAPPRPQGRRSRGIIWTALGGCRPAERRQGREWRLGVQKPLVAGQGKTVPSAVLLVAVGRSIPGGPSRPLAVRNPGSDGGGRAAPDPGLRRRRCRVGAGLESKVDTFSSLSPMRSVKWCREWQMTAQVSSYSGWSGGTWPSRLTNTVGARVRSLGSCGSGGGAAAVLCLVVPRGLFMTALQ
jgi:hypothetical protein